MTAGTLAIEKVLQEDSSSVYAAYASMRYKVPASQYVMWIKRLADVLLSVILTVAILSWLVPLLFVVIRLGSRGPLFFVQPRVGLNGRVFNCLKFRTMYDRPFLQDDEADNLEQRITPIGLYLRISHIDELPQLLNVLSGSMSLIGPRPHMMDDHRSFSDLVDVYPFRHLVKPGITGLAQAYGLHGNTPDYFSIAHRTRLDLFYVRKQSFLLDLHILLRTCRSSFSFLINIFRNGYKSK